MADVVRVLPSDARKGQANDARSKRRVAWSHRGSEPAQEEHSSVPVFSRASWSDGTTSSPSRRGSGVPKSPATLTSCICLT